MSAATTVAPQDTPEGSMPKRNRTVFTLSFSGAGIAVAAIFFSISLQPSLLPRGGAVQGLASGISAVIGYGIGAGGQALWTYLQIPALRGRVRAIVLGVIFALIALSVALSIWQQVGWQNEIREQFGMQPVSAGTWPVIIVVMVVVFTLILIVSRSLRLLFGTVGRWAGRHIPRRLAIVLSTVVLLLIFWSLITGVLVNGFFSAANTLFASRDSATAPGIEQPVLPELSGSPASLVKWEELGRQGRNFVATGPTAADINAFSGGGALSPIRSYVGLKSADTLQERADLLLAELKRAGAFNRKALVLTTTTGTGFLDPAGVDPVEYIFNGDIAVAGVQYSYLPSWISLLADQDAVQETSRVVFDTVHDYWAELPESTRPKFYLYGLSLGSFGVESVLNSIDVINEPIDGSVMSGPPFVNRLHSQLLADREPGTTPAMPVYGDGRTVRFLTEQGFADSPGPWGPTRLVYIQHGSDPIVFFAPSLLWSEPDWLEDGQRPPDVSARMDWFPLVTFWQVAADLPGAAGVPKGFGHEYSWRTNTQAWVAVANPPGWTPAKTDKLVALLESQSHFSE